MSRYAEESSQIFTKRVEKTPTADDALSNHGQATHIDFIYASIFADIESPLSIPTEVTHHKYGSVSATSNLDDLIGTEKPLDLPELAKITMTGGAFFVTKKGYIGICPSSVQSGDVIAIFRGMIVPFFIRQHAIDLFVLVGDCYIHDILAKKAVWMSDEA